MSQEANNSENRSPYSEQHNDDQMLMPQQSKRTIRGQNITDPASYMKMGMMNPMQYPQFQQMMFMQQMQHQQQVQQMTAAAAAAAAMAATSNPATTIKPHSKIPSEDQEPPSGYVCFKCGQPGHWIYYCPNVPKGQFVPRVGSGNRYQTNQQQQTQVPHEFTCIICNKLMTDASLVPCCGKSFCKECTYSLLIPLLQLPLSLYYCFLWLYQSVKATFDEKIIWERLSTGSSTFYFYSTNNPMIHCNIVLFFAIFSPTIFEKKKGKERVYLFVELSTTENYYKEACI
ncbi:hypothetical protein BDF20DRAFT_374495 [Mycotypha africana]|uniref:uncharacterized protein n=1 Tax=Mycotypha africana TaxID=64632 RepID=UPI00230108E8|nr:uncharacterized protein BDF20DRAFT_374495 [Mycotypha africana]KAI8984257.1 hypothetical protein BDF20DRAFT_374495 [Mycotypha africana]